MNTEKSRTELIMTTHHAALIDLEERVGVGVHVAPEELSSEAIARWWSSRADLDAELRVLDLAVVALLEGGRFLVGSAPWRLDDPEQECEDGLTPPELRHLTGPPASPLWGPGALPVHADGAEAVVDHPALADLWAELMEV